MVRQDIINVQLKQDLENQIGYITELLVTGIMKVELLRIEDLWEVVSVNAY